MTWTQSATLGAMGQLNYTPEQLQQLVAGDADAWADFVERAAPFIYSVIYTLLRIRRGRADEHEAAEIFQQVCLRLIQHDYRVLRAYDPQRAGLGTWLTIIARSTTLDYLRRARLETVPFDEEFDAAAPTPADTTPTTALIPPDVLTQRQQLVLHLLWDQGMEVEETATVLGVDAQTVRSTKHKAVERLRNFYRGGDADTTKHV